MPGLMLIANLPLHSRGIDLDAANELGITVSGTQAGGNTSSGTVEQTWALILASRRRIVQEQASVLNGHWQVGLASGIAGKTLGLVGVGRLGTAVGRVGKAFGMRVIGWSPHLTQERADVAGVELGESLDELLRTADVVSLHLVSSETTKGIIGARELALLKPTSTLVNTSRGPLIDEAALIEFIKEEANAGVALDVFDQEPLPASHPFRTVGDQLLLSPHMGTCRFYSQVLSHAD